MSEVFRSSSSQLRSSKKKKKRKKQEKNEFDQAGVRRLILSELAQKIVGCVVGENVTGEKPWVFVDKEKIVDNLELHEGSSEFLSLKTELLEFQGKQFLLGYIPDETKDYDEFYICYTDQAIRNVCYTIEKRQQEQEARLFNSIYKEIKIWADRGSKYEVDDAIVRNTRPLLEVEIQTQYPIFPVPAEFTIVKAEDRRDGYMELKCPENLFHNVYRKRIDDYVQVAPQLNSTEAQTICAYPSNVATQYKFELENLETLFQNDKEKIQDYMHVNYLQLSDILRVNGAINLYSDDYSHLVSSGEFESVSTLKEVKEYTSFMDVNLGSGKKIADAVWHPMWSGTVAVAYCEVAPTVFRWGPNTTDSVLKAVYSRNLVLIWSTIDGLHPKLILECTREVYMLSFCKFDENVLIGGCKNGQIVIWDIRNKIQRVEELEVLTTAQQKYRSYMYSQMGWMKNIRDLSLVRPAAISDLRYSHKGPVTGITWLSPFYEFSKIGNLSEIPEGAEHSLQFITSSEDGSIMIWDLLKKPIIQPGGFKIRKLRRLEKKPSALLLEASPYDILHLNMKPIYRVNLQRKDNKKLNWISSCSANYCYIKYEVKDEEEAKKPLTISERVIYKPIFQKSGTPKPYLHVGTMAGEYCYLKWDGRDFDSGEVVNSEYAQILSLSRYHDAPIVSVHTTSLDNVVLTVGGKLFALWHESYPNRPILWRQNRELYTSGHFSLDEPYSWTIKTMSGTIELWIPFMSSKSPVYTMILSNGYLTTSENHTLPLKKPVFGVGDKQGNYRLFYSGKTPDPDKIAQNSVRFKRFIEREIACKRMYFKWQQAWYDQNSDIIREYEEELRKQAEKEKAEAEKKAKEQEQEEKEPPARTGNFIDWIIEQRHEQEMQMIKSTVIAKKQLDTKELERRRKPLQMLDEENVRKKRKQKQRLKEGEQIFRSTVASLFPQIIKQKPIPPPDPYAGGDAMEDLEADYHEFLQVEKDAVDFVEQHPFVSHFAWKDILSGGRKRRQAPDNISSDGSRNEIGGREDVDTGSQVKSSKSEKDETVQKEVHYQ